MIRASQVGVILHPVGIAYAILVILCIVGLSIVNKQRSNRMTVRLIAAIAVADLFSHSAELYSSYYSRINLSSSLCHAVNGFRLFSRTLYSFTNLAICFHLYRSLVQMKKSTWKFELYTYIVTLVMVAVFTLIYWALGALTGTQGKAGCNPGADDRTLNAVFYIIAGLVDLFTMISGLYITIVGHRNLDKWINVYSATLTENGGNRDQIIKDRRKMAIRSFLYPLSTCITLPFETIFLFLNGFGLFVIEITIPMAITIGLSGILTALAFAIDPATHQAFLSAFYKIMNRDNEKKRDEDYSLDVN